MGLLQIVERNGRLCGCTQRGCLEAYSSAEALVLEAQEHVTAGADSTLAAYPLESITAKLIFKLAAEGDAMCARLIAEVHDDIFGILKGRFSGEVAKLAMDD